jgi:hypothetical protein
MKHSTLRRRVVLSAVVCVVLAIVACGGSGIKGTYSSTSGTMLLELRSGGKASFTMMGETQDCTCGKNETDFRIMDDGSLTSKSPFVGATFGVLRKTK